MLFVETHYTLATEEAERIGVDHVARLSNTGTVDASTGLHTVLVSLAFSKTSAGEIVSQSTLYSLLSQSPFFISQFPPKSLPPSFPRHPYFSQFLAFLFKLLLSSLFSFQVPTPSFSTTSHSFLSHLPLTPLPVPIPLFSKYL